MDDASFKELIKERDEYLAKVNGRIEKEGKQFVAGVLLPLFDKYPEMENFAWTQGQVYNDETYDFRVNNWDGCIYINGQRSYDIRHSGVAGPIWFNDATQDISKALEGLLSNDDFELIFGDGSKIIVSRDKIEIEDYYCGFRSKSITAAVR